jgi:hypothetical protein
MLNIFQIAAIAIIAYGCCKAFSPYFAQRYRTDIERWSTRERAFGHVYYEKLKNDPDRHHTVYNRPCNKTINVIDNVIIVN